MSDTSTSNPAPAGQAANPADVVQVPADELLQLRETHRKYAGLEAETAASFIDRDLSAALAASGNLLPGVADQVARLWKDDFQARLNSAEYAHFLAATITPGSGAHGRGQSSTPTGQHGDHEAARRQRFAAEMAIGLGSGTTRDLGFKGTR